MSSDLALRPFTLVARHGELGLRSGSAQDPCHDPLAGAGDGQALINQETPDLEDQLDLLAAQKLMAATGLPGLQLLELVSPHPQLTRLDVSQPPHLDELEELLTLGKPHLVRHSHTPPENTHRLPALGTGTDMMSADPAF